MWQKVTLLLAVFCMCLTYDVTAYNTGRQQFKNGPQQGVRAGPRSGYLGQTGPSSGYLDQAGPSGGYIGQGADVPAPRGTQGRGDEKQENKGRGINVWPSKFSKGNQPTIFDRPEDKADTQNRPTGRGAGLARYRRDYGYGFNRGYFPGGGFYGPGFGDGPGGDFGGHDSGYGGSDNWRSK